MRRTELPVDQTLLQRILDALPVGIWVAAPDGTLAFNNPAARAIWQGELWVGMDGYGEYKAWWSDTGEALTAQDWGMSRALRDGETSIDEIIDIQCFDGSRKTILNSALPVRDGHGETACIVALNQDVTGLRANFTRLEQAHKQMEALAIEGLSIQEEERKRLSRELHDEVGQSLSALKIALGTLRCNCHDRTCDPGLDIALDIADGLIDTVRDIARRLRPAQLDELGLTAALRWHLDKTPWPNGLEISFEEDVGADRLPAEIELCCFRVVQEALTNIQRHASANQVILRLRREHRRLKLSISDDGQGFDLEETTRRPLDKQPLGLLGMKERVTGLGGEFRVITQSGLGTSIDIALPL